MIKLLFVLYDFYPNFGANSIIIHNLAEVFTEQGYEVHILTLKTYSDLPEEEEWKCLYIHRVTHTFDRHQVKLFLQELHFYLALRLSLSMIKDRLTMKEYEKPSWYYYCGKRLSDILSQHSIDVVINVCYPFESCLPILHHLKGHKKTFGWLIYMQDPFATNYYYLSKYSSKDLLRHQQSVFQRADRIIVTPQIMKELKPTLSKDSLHKYQALHFPKIKKPYYRPSRDDISFDNHYINCVYVGKFNRITRNPAFLFRLFEGLRRDHIRLHIIGEEREDWREFMTDASGNIYFYGVKSREASLNAQLSSNVLVNLGNTVMNQMPSKLMEYISTGKPIINLYHSMDCPTLDFMRDYPVACNIFIEEQDFSQKLRRLRHFCIKYRRRVIKYRYIHDKFYYGTVDYISSELLNLFDEMMVECR